MKELLRKGGNQKLKELLQINMLELEELGRLIAKKDLNKKDSHALRIFSRAIRDWPETVKSVDEFVDKVEAFVSRETTLNNIRERANENVLQSAWQVESLSQVCDIYPYYPDCKTLREILNALKSDLGIL